LEPALEFAPAHDFALQGAAEILSYGVEPGEQGSLTQEGRPAAGGRGL